ncbi:MAG: Uncharacterised protein [Opitutia bacterium UBA7350]|nr:MAG: Uncharacterised protein [Opitutae bacterium UBA7350]
MQTASAIPVGRRQIHLDFHTSEYLKAIGAGFDKGDFQAALKLGQVDAVNLFAKCHHSWSYYPTKVGRMHPELRFDLLGAQIEACREIGIKVQIYYTFGWSAGDAESHPEWCMRDRAGNFVTQGELPIDSKPEDPMPDFYWKFLCPNTTYHSHIMAQVKELCERYAPEGFWFDIYQVQRHCFCKSCRRDMHLEGVDCEDSTAVGAFAASKMQAHCKALSGLIAEYHPEAQIFFNGTTAIEAAGNFHHRMYANNTVQDLEDLPTVWGGYDKLPLQSKYFLQAGYAITGMSGKFHTAWGEFGGFKHPDALRYEAASMIAWGAHCNFGDQMHPSGCMDQATYTNIGEAYAYVKKIEDYGIEGLPIARLGFWRSFSAEHDEGLAKILLEGQINFEVANVLGDLGRYDVIIVPGAACLSADEAQCLDAFAKAGGKVLALGAGALSEAGECLLDIGADFLGEAKFDRDYLALGETLKRGLVESPFLNFKACRRFQAHDDTEILAWIHEPYFSRTQAQYCSHQNTPHRLKASAHPAIFRKGGVISIAPELDWMYYKHGARLHRDLLLQVLHLVHLRPMIKTSLPSAGRLAFLQQEKHKRYVAHLLYAPPMQRGNCEVIEDLPPLFEVPLSFDLPETITSVTLVPDGISLPINHADEYSTVVVPKFSCHCAIVLDYA